MRWRCFYCGKPTAPYLSIAGLPVGPKCAKRMGLTREATKKNPRVKWHARQAPVTTDEAQAELFEAEA